MEEKLLKKRVKDDKVHALVYLPLNTDPYVVRSYSQNGLEHSSKFGTEGKSKEFLDRISG